MYAITERIWNKFRSLYIKDFGFYRKSFSQMAEDMIAATVLDKKQGFYVDVGAYHPKRFSNTYYFYQQKWHGINIDGSEEAIALLKRYRKRDISVQAVIGNEKDNIKFFEFNQRELNTIVHEELPEIEKYHGQIPVRVTDIQCRSLSGMLEQYLPPETEIDLLNVDAEGADELVLRSNNWNKFQPKVIIVEKHASLNNMLQSTLYEYLSGLQYSLYGFCKHAYIFTHAKLVMP